MKKKKFIPKESVKLPPHTINEIWSCAEEKERLKLLGELYNDPVQFLNDYFTDDQMKMIAKEIVKDAEDENGGDPVNPFGEP